MIADHDLGIPYTDSGVWRTYALGTWGVTITELVQNATIFELDKHGEELDAYALEDADALVANKAIDVIAVAYNQYKDGSNICVWCDDYFELSELNDNQHCYKCERAIRSRA